MFASSSKAPGVLEPSFMQIMGRLGEWVWAQWDELRHAAAVIGTAGVASTALAKRTGIAAVATALACMVGVLAVSEVPAA